ncbi:MAG: RecX family transcriptional regulator [Prevotella sp.]|nr:RecX family transcriptional regulator [Prevotella sp.]MDD6863359.1 regulatory protein RecX [Prevotella sp.]
MTEEQALQKLAALCSQSEHCTSEMKEKMTRWGIDEDAQQRVVEYLVANRYVDDRRYARSFVNDKLKYNKWGPRKIEQSLWMKHIDESIQREALDDVDNEEYISVLRPLLTSKRKTTKAETDYEMNQKLLRFAIGRGFTFEQVKEVIDDVDE